MRCSVRCKQKRSQCRNYIGLKCVRDCSTAEGVHRHPCRNENFVLAAVIDFLRTRHPCRERIMQTWLAGNEAKAEVRKAKRAQQRKCSQPAIRQVTPISGKCLVWAFFYLKRILPKCLFKVAHATPSSSAMERLLLPSKISCFIYSSKGESL